MNRLRRISVSLEPTFHEDAGVTESFFKMQTQECFYISEAQIKLDFDVHLALVSSQSWVVTPKHLCVWSGGKDHHLAAFYLLVCEHIVLLNLSMHARKRYRTQYVCLSVIFLSHNSGS